MQKCCEVMSFLYLSINRTVPKVYTFLHESAWQRDLEKQKEKVSVDEVYKMLKEIMRLTIREKMTFFSENCIITIYAIQMNPKGNIMILPKSKLVLWKLLVCLI